MAALVLIEFRLGNDESIAKQLNETNAFYNTHKHYFEQKGFKRENVDLLGTLDDMFVRAPVESARKLLNARENGDLKGNDEKLRLLFALSGNKQYPKALKFGKELLSESFQELGPEHQDTHHMIGLIDLIKEEYRAYLLERREQSSPRKAK